MASASLHHRYSVSTCNEYGGYGPICVAVKFGFGKRKVNMVYYILGKMIFQKNTDAVSCNCCNEV